MQASFVPRRTLAACVALMLAVLAGGGVVSAQTSGGEGAGVEVQNVRFGQVRAPGGGDGWIEAVVELNVTPATDGGVYSRWADAVRVGLSIAVRTRSGDYAFYRAAAEAVALEAGRASFRFYLPPEVARREQLNSAEPHAWLVDVSVAGTPLTAGPRQVSALLGSPEALRSFKDRVTRSATAHDGVFVAQSESPFAQAYAGETPTFVRR